MQQTLRRYFGILSLLSFILGCLSVKANAQATFELKTAANIKVGDVIACHNDQTGSDQWKQIRALNEVELAGTVTIHLVNIANGQPGQPITCDATKRFVSGRDSIAASDFQVGHTLTAKNGVVFRISDISHNDPITITEVQVGPLSTAQFHLRPLPPSMPQPNIPQIETGLASLKINPADPGLTNLKVGDLIQCRDKSSGNFVMKQVAFAQTRTVRTMLAIALADAKTGRPAPPMVYEPSDLVQTISGYVRASQVGIGTSIIPRAGPRLLVIAIVRRQMPPGFSIADVRVSDPKSFQVASNNLNGLIEIRSAQEPGLRLSGAVLAQYQVVSQESSGDAATYAYNADGLRISKNVAGVTTSYTWDETAAVPQLIEEDDTAGNTTSYVYAPDTGQLICIIRNGIANYPLQDGSGSTTQVADTTGSIIASASYDAFGNIVASSGTLPSSVLYNSQEFDAETGNYYLRARYENAETGTFLSQDPFQGYRIEPQTLRPYVYASDDPVNRMDPSGRDDIAETLSAEADSITLDSLDNAGVQGAREFAENGIAEAADADSAEGLVERGASDPAAAEETIQDLSDANSVGQQGEDLAQETWNFTKNTKNIDDYVGKRDFRIPDQLDTNEKIIGEVKNVRYQYLSSQIQNDITYAARAGGKWTFNLYVRSAAMGGTQLSAPLQALVDAGQITLKAIDGGPL